MLNYVPHVVDIDKSSNMFGENYKYYLCIVVIARNRETRARKKVMNMETSVSISVNGTSIDWHELDNSISDRVKVLLHARDMVGFATVRDVDQSSTPLEVTMDLSGVPLATVNNLPDTLQLEGLGDMTAVDYNEALNEVHEKLINAIGNDRELLKAVMECSLGQLFLVLREIKETIDGAADQKE